MENKQTIKELKIRLLKEPTKRRAIKREIAKLINKKNSEAVKK